MNCFAFERSSPDRGSAPWRERMTVVILPDPGRKAVIRGAPVDGALTAKHNSPFCVAKLRCRLNQRIKHGLQIESRAADDLEHVGGGGLPLQRFAQLPEQPRILDGNNGLVGKVLDELN